MREMMVSSLLFTSFIQAILALYAWSRRRERSVMPLVYLGVACFAWAFTYGLDLASDNIQVKTLWMQIRFSFTVFISLIILMFTLDYLELSEYLTRQRWTALLLVPTLTIALLWTSLHHPLFRYDFTITQVGALPILTWKNGPAFWLVLCYAYLLSATSLYLLMRSLASASLIKRRQTSLILIGVSLPMLTDLLYNFGLSPVSRFNFTPLVLSISWVLLAYAVFRYHLLDIVPLARSALVDFLPSGVIVLDTQHRIVDINPSAQQVLGVTASIIGKKSNTILQNFKPGDLGPFNSALPRQEVSLRRPGGETAHYDVQTIPLLNQKGQSKGRMIMFHDVTERQNRELRLLQLTQTVEQSPTSVVITDLKGKIEYVNPHFTLLTGFSPEEVIGKTSSVVQSGQTPPEVYQEMWQTIQSGQTWRGEFLNRKKNGELYWELAVIAPVKDANGKLVNYIAVKENITEQKAAAEALRQTNVQLEEKIAQISALQAELRQQATHDPLTGLYNRRNLNEFLEREIAIAQRGNQPLSVALMDIDHFKDINDQYGHQLGDEVLKSLAQLLKRHARKSDLIYRYGGEEFLLIFPSTPLAIAARRAEELRLRFQETPLAGQELKLRITASFGVASYPDQAQNIDALLIKADQALYRAKREGRNRVAWED